LKFDAESEVFVIQKTLSLAEWQKLGFDTDSEVTDPMFLDPAHDDYRLKPESPRCRRIRINRAFRCRL